MSHTPGPWRVSHDEHEPYWNIDMPMQDGSSGYGFGNAMVYTTESDARLIAAAPELLAALKLLRDPGGAGQWPCYCNDPHYYGGQCENCIATAVIDKAEGRAE